MGKSVPSPTRLQDFAKIITSNRLPRSSQVKPVSRARPVSAADPLLKRKAVRIESSGQQQQQLTASPKMEEESSSSAEERRRLPLSEVVADCVKRWFQDTLKEAKAGDPAMQVLVGQMYYSGYGVARDAQKGRAWIGRASKSRSSVWKVGDKHPGYNVSDSDSDDTKSEPK